jgi:hypothetical protein
MYKPEKFNRLLLPAILSLLAGGCSFAEFIGFENESADTAVVEYNPDCLRNYRAGRDFAAAGRYELAREHYILALASSGGSNLREALTHELDNIDLMIKSLR